MKENKVTLELILPKTVSLNTLYSGKHWTYRKKIKDAYKKEVETALAGYDHYYAESMRIRISYNSRLDVDNVVLVAKFVADTVVDLGYVYDDSPRYYTELRIKYDSEIDKNFCNVKIDLFNPSIKN